MRLRTTQFMLDLEKALEVLAENPEHDHLTDALRIHLEAYREKQKRLAKGYRVWRAANPDKIKGYRTATAKKRENPLIDESVSPAERIDAMVAKLREPLFAKTGQLT
jgi:hypothetical protein